MARGPERECLIDRVVDRGLVDVDADMSFPPA